MRSSKHGDRPGAQARFRPWRWPEGDAELPSNSAGRRRRWRRRSRSRSPTATAKLTCRSPSSRERLLQTLNGGAERWNLSFSASAHTHTRPHRVLGREGAVELTCPGGPRLRCRHQTELRWTCLSSRASGQQHCFA